MNNNLKPNDLLTDENGRLAKLITMPIVGRSPALAVILYDDSRGVLVDLSKCKKGEPLCPPNESS